MADDTFIFIPKGAPYIDTGVSPSVTYQDGQIHAFDSADADELAAAGRIQTAGAGFDVSTLLAAATGLTLGGQTKIADGSAAAPALAFANNTGTGIFRAATNVMGFAFAGVQFALMRQGRFDINTSAGNGVLNVEGGTGVAAEFSRGDNGQILELDGAGYSAHHTLDGTAYFIGHDSTGRGLGLQTANSTALYITPTQRVAIGTTSPSFRFQVSDLTADTVGYFQGATTGARISIARGSSFDWDIGLDSSSKFFIETGGGGRALTIDPSTQYIGIGTTSPGAKLHVDGNIRVGGVAASSGDVGIVATGSSSYSPGLQARNFDAAGWARIDLYHQSASASALLYQTSSGAMYFRNDASTSLPFLWLVGAATKMVMNSSGNVGIGTTSPSAQLHVLSSASTVAAFQSTGSSIVYSEGLSGYGSFYAKGSGTNPAYLFFGNTSGEQARISGDQSGTLTLRASGPVIAFQNNAGTVIAQMNATGLGLGTTSPGDVLHTVKTSSGAETFIIHQNSAATINTGAGLRLAPSAFPSGTVRAAEVVGVLAAAGTSVDLVFRTSNGAAPADRMRIRANGVVNISNLPTSSAGLATGDIWNDGGTLKAA